MIDGPENIGAADRERDEAKRENGVSEAGAEVLPEGHARARIIGGKQESEHKDQTAQAGWADQDAERQGEADGKLAIGDQERDGGGVREDEPFQDGDHERVGAALGEEFVDPELKAAVQSELRAENLVLAEDQKKYADGDAKEDQGSGVGVAGDRGCWGFAGLSHSDRLGARIKRGGSGRDRSTLYRRRFCLRERPWRL